MNKEDKIVLFAKEINAIKDDDLKNWQLQLFLMQMITSLQYLHHQVVNIIHHFH